MSSLDIIILQLQILNTHFFVLAWYAIIQNNFNLDTVSHAGNLEKFRQVVVNAANRNLEDIGAVNG